MNKVENKILKKLRDDAHVGNKFPENQTAEMQETLKELVKLYFKDKDPKFTRYSRCALFKILKESGMKVSMTTFYSWWGTKHE